MASKPEESDKLYSRIIYKSPNDENLQDMLKKGKSSGSPRRYKKWSPEISYEERIIRKKRREEQYIKKIYPDERPILLVKKKHVFKNLDQAELIGGIPEEETSFKISRNTELLADVDDDINENEKFIRRFTMVHDRHKDPKAKPMPKKEDKGAVYKVEGVEYLPEGFLELDPLLMKDEFYFDSKALENMFLKEQRRVKALRRKQYSEKNYLKKRDVTIYVIDQYKDRIIEFMELWYDKYKRKMRDSELREVASRLKTNYENLHKLQELFLKKRKLVRTQQLRDYHLHMGTDRARSPSGNSIPRKIGDYLRAAGEYDYNKLDHPANLKWGRSKQGNLGKDWSKSEHFGKNYAQTGPSQLGRSEHNLKGSRMGPRRDYDVGYRQGTGDMQRYARGTGMLSGISDTQNGQYLHGNQYRNQYGYPHGNQFGGTQRGRQGRANDYGYKMPIRKSAEAMRYGSRGKSMR